LLKVYPKQKKNLKSCKNVANDEQIRRLQKAVKKLRLKIVVDQK
jgi:hypothetical protein